MNGFLKVAVRNLRRNKRRNLATGVAIAIGFAAFLALGGYAHRVENMLRVQTVYLGRSGHISIYKRDGLDKFSTDPALYSLSPQDQEKIEAALGGLPQVDFYGAELSGVGLIGNGCRSVPFQATGFDPQLDLKIRSHPELERWLPRIAGPTRGKSIGHYPPDFGGIAISEGLSTYLNKERVYDEIPLDAAIVLPDCQAEDVKRQLSADANVQLVSSSWDGLPVFKDGEVVAIYNTGVTETNHIAILTPLSYLQSFYETEHVTSISIWLEPGADLASAMESLGKALAGADVDIYRWDDETISPFYVGTVQFLFTLIFFLGGILATIIAFSIFNAATMTVIERTQEIGMMRAMGFSRFHVRRLFVLEIFALSLSSMLLGGLGGGAFIWLINRAEIHLSPPGVAGGLSLLIEPDLLTVIIGCVLTIAVAVATTLIAVRRTILGKIPVLLMGSHR